MPPVLGSTYEAGEGTVDATSEEARDQKEGVDADTFVGSLGEGARPDRR